MCGEECNRSYNLLKPMGKYILYGSSNVVTGETKSFFSVARSWWQVDKVSPIKLFDENKSLAGFNLRHLLYQQGGVEYVRKTMATVFDLWSTGKIKPVVDSVYALEDVAEAMQKMHDRKNIGKLVLDPAMEPKPKPATPAKTKGKSKKEEKADKAAAAAAGGDKDEKKENGESSSPESPTTNGEGEKAATEEAAASPEAAAPAAAAAVEEKKKENGEASDKGELVIFRL